MMEGTSRFILVFADILLPLALGMWLRRKGLAREWMRCVIRANVVGVSTFLSVVSFWSVKVSADLLWLPVSTFPICFLPIAVFYAFEQKRFQDPREQGSYMISMMLGNIGTLAGLCAYALYGAAGFAYVQLIAVPQILIIVLVAFPAGQYYYEKWVHAGNPGSIEIHPVKMLLTWNQLPAAGVAAGLLLAAAGAGQPDAVSLAFTAFIYISAWMGMTPVGYDLQLGGVKRYAWKLWAVFPVKFLLLPAVLYGLSRCFIEDPAILVCVTLAAAAPTAIFAVAAVQLYQLNVDLAEASFVTTTIVFLFLIYPAIYWWAGTL